MGPVRSVITERRMDTGVLAKIGEVLFDEAGNIVRRFYTTVKIERHSDAGRTEVQDVGESPVWSMDGLHGVGFGTHRAASARTTFDVRGIPVETALVDADGDVLSRLLYLCNSSGAIQQAVQYAGEKVPPWATQFLDAAVVRAHVEEGNEQARAMFEYDDAGRLTSTRTYFVGELCHSDLRTYNDRGDVLALTTDDGAAEVYEYQYDHWGNWIRKTVTTGDPTLGSIELRSIKYYGE